MTCLKADCGFCANAVSEVSSFTFSIVWLYIVHAELLNFSTRTLATFSELLLLI
jgi:hypothetical protein